MLCVCYVLYPDSCLLTSIVLNDEERCKVAQAHADQLAKAKGPVTLLLPQLGLGEWDREGADLHNKEGLESFLAEIEARVPDHVDVRRINGHINDPIFADTALEIFDQWCEEGIVER